MKVEANPATAAPPRVCAVVLNWNGRDDTRRCLSSLALDGYPALEVVVIDNGSTDGSREAVQEEFPTVRCVQNALNVGIARAFNQGIDEAESSGATFVFFLNNDSTVEPGCLSALVLAAQAMPDAGLVVPLIIEQSLDPASRPEVWYAGGSYSLFLGVPEHMGRHGDVPAREQRSSPPREVTFATGCALLARLDLFERVGRFDERFFAYAEDADLGIRARSQGFRILYVPWARVRHQVGATLRRTTGEASRFRLATANLLRLERKHARWYHWPSFVVWFGGRWLLFLTVRHGLRLDLPMVKAVWKGFAEGLSGK